MSTQPKSRASEGDAPPGKISNIFLALLAATVFSVVILAGRQLSSGPLEVGQPAALTLRVSPFVADATGKNPQGAIAIERGQVISADLAASHSELAPTPIFAFALWLAISVFCILWSLLLESCSRGKRTRNRLAITGTIFAISAVSLGVLLASNIAAVALPAALIGILVRKRATRTTAIASAILGTLVLCLLLPFDLFVLCILLVQAVVPPLLLPKYASPGRILFAGAVAGCVAGLAYLLAYLAAWSVFPTSSLGQSGALAAFAGAAFSSLLAMVLQPLFSWISGDPSIGTLVKLQRLSQPLLKQMATQAPGSWQHCLAVARLCEQAGGAIGADVQLLRVGAYYHDLGKTKKPKYYIENNSGGDHSIHDTIKPSDSRDGIFAHVDLGVRIARENGLPERVIDFIRTHHGGGLLEFFWEKELQTGNPQKQSIDRFCYPGGRPQCPETAILCICDAVEAASRNCSSMTQEQSSDIVRHIIFGKVLAGQLDDCGLTLTELRHIHVALTNTLAEAHAPVPVKGHAVDIISTKHQRPSPSAPKPRESALASIRLDSHDKPSNQWKTDSAGDSGSLTTQPIHADPSANSEFALGDTMAVISDNSDVLETDDQAKIRTAEITLEPNSKKQPLVSTLDLGKSLAESAGDSEPILLSKSKESKKSLALPRDTIPNHREPEELEEWQDALNATSSANTPVPWGEFSPAKTMPPTPPRPTIPLEEAFDAQTETSEAPAKSNRADSQDGLRPGEMVIGPPPSTHPERSALRAQPISDVTVRRHMPMPSEAHRPTDSGEEELTFSKPRVTGPFLTRKTGAPSGNKDPK